MTPLEQIRLDLEAEQQDLGAVLVRLSAKDWERDSHAPGWKVRDQVAHLAYFDEAATRGILDPDGFRREIKEGQANPEAGPSYLEKARDLSHAEVLAWWERASSGLIKETWSHGLDVVDVVPFERPATDRIRHVAFIGVRARPFSYVTNGREPNNEEVFVDLVLPSGAPWQSGNPEAKNRISGSAEQFAKVACQRRHLADTQLKIEGEAAIEWMSIAQAFAGPPGQGRRPGEFPDG
ncbi:MAG: maleylpyruvate isomerase family mycothiol-dependent enzyme [Dehalococcoidia bacterium]